MVYYYECNDPASYIDCIDHAVIPYPPLETDLFCKNKLGSFPRLVRNLLYGSQDALLDRFVQFPKEF
jgi:hypothetical protein